MEEVYEKAISRKEIEEEIKAAEAEQRDATFPNKTIRDLNLSERNLKCGFDFKSSVFLGNIFFGRTKIEGGLVLDNSIVKGTLYLGEARIEKDFSASNVIVKNSFNMVKGFVGGEINLEGGHIQGFLSLSGAHVKGNVNFREINTVNLATSSGTIKGDLFLRQMTAEGFVDLKGSRIAGLADLEKINVGKYLSLRDVKITEVLIMRESYIGDDSFFEGLECEKRIVSF